MKVRVVTTGEPSRDPFALIKPPLLTLKTTYTNYIKLLIVMELVEPRKLHWQILVGGLREPVSSHGQHCLDLLIVDLEADTLLAVVIMLSQYSQTGNYRAVTVQGFLAQTQHPLM